MSAPSSAHDLGTVMDAARRVKEAIENEGSHPEYHRQVLRRHRTEWHALWKTIDVLISLVDEIDRREGGAA